MKVRANVVDIHGRKILPCEIGIVGKHIDTISPLGDSIDPSLPFALPGFIDAHVHIESSMLVPSEFARLASIHGTVAIVTDPHEIANVMGVEGIDFMIENASRVPMKFCFGAPSCVPATSFETSGATIDSNTVAMLLERPEISYLAEMMNYPGVLLGDTQVVEKIKAAHSAGKPIDGHAPGLSGEQLAAYIAAGISTDHECTTLAEALDKLRHGMKILIREGSAAKNFEALKSLVNSHPASVMFCSDDKHPDELAEGHIDVLVRRAIDDGADLYNVLRIACLNPIEHYHLPVGQLRIGDAADFILVKDLRSFRIHQTVVDGQCIAENGKTRIQPVAVGLINRFQCDEKQPSDFRIKTSSQESTVTVRVIQAIDGKLVTGAQTATLQVSRPSYPSFPGSAWERAASQAPPVKTTVERQSLEDSVSPGRARGQDDRAWGQDVSTIIADRSQDVLKIAVVNRYRAAPLAVAFITGFGLQRGAIASSVGHDSHNILAVGVDDESLCAAVNCVIAHRGGIAAVDGDMRCILPLPIAGIMTDRDGAWVAKEYRRIDQFAKQRLGSSLSAPFMTLSFMGLLVIPKLKLSDHGLFDAEKFEFVSVVL